MLKSLLYALLAAMLAAVISFSFVTSISVVVNKHDSPVTYNATQENNSESNKPEKGFWYIYIHDPTAFFTGVLAVFTIVLASATVVLIKTTQRGIMEQGELTKKAIDVSTRAAVANEDSTNIGRLTMIASNRPYVRYNGIRYFSHRDEILGNYFWSIRPSWANAGNTPTVDTKLHIGFLLSDDVIGEDYEYPCEAPGNIDIFQGGTIGTGIFNISDTDLFAVRERIKFFYVWGYTEYNDKFPNTSRYITKFCVQAVRVDGDVFSQWNATENPVEIHFATFGKFNCHDDACYKKENQNPITEPRL